MRQKKRKPTEEVTILDDENDGKMNGKSAGDQPKVPNHANNFMRKLYTNGQSGSISENKAGSAQTQAAEGTSSPSRTKKMKPSKPSTSAYYRNPMMGHSSRFEVEFKQPTVKFKDVGGCDRQFLDICRLAMHLKRPSTYSLIGAEPTKGVLIHGPPGCGKSLFAQILDDIDSIAPRKEVATREMERRVVSQLCCSLDDLFSLEPQQFKPENLKFSSDGDVTYEEDVVCVQKDSPKHVFVIGTTSRPDALDGGLRRAGRFDSEISLGIPDEKSRIEILNRICENPEHVRNVDFKKIARLTPGYVGADLKALFREAGKCAVNRLFNAFAIGEEKELKEKKMKISVQEELDKALKWLNTADDTESLTGLKDFAIAHNDFEEAIKNVQPSAKREGFATVPDVSWRDIGALHDVRHQLEWNILYPVQRPEDFEILDIEARPHGVLLCGPPGCGKTLLAKAVANEAGLNFISVKGPELLNMYVGESERAVRTVFQRARDSAPCIIFFDEIDALAPKRSQSETSGSARLVNQMLTEMDGIGERKQVFLIAATNRPGN
ncbi:hypothetical protein WR25_20563 isoform D [Diploscapter pachys]|uniref:AAA+ ATPase domain-containing protein n=1 Tax=Diploscapter pachys TaxID=2018661 RepID=A0A2A2JT29_9BILA|nr:hypothetical protein WR25_20563 isoform B [Diploscapter pachys]PAV64731.1 hypothetical protein WR25_20563 isoform C [Diploscapter pachys]PAV64732.1 hypothetical protein WR25_20563 isoform D [Diploscapter pachys]